MPYHLFLHSQTVSVACKQSHSTAELDFTYCDNVVRIKEHLTNIITGTHTCKLLHVM